MTLGISPSPRRKPGSSPPRRAEEPFGAQTRAYWIPASAGMTQASSSRGSLSPSVVKEQFSPLKGAARRKAQSDLVRALRHAGASRRATLTLALPRFAHLERYCASHFERVLISRRLFVAHRAPLSVAGYGRSVSQLLAGTHSGPGGSPGAARVPDRDPARGRRAPSRFRNASRQRPSKDEVGRV